MKIGQLAPWGTVFHSTKGSTAISPLWNWTQASEVSESWISIDPTTVL